MQAAVRGWAIRKAIAAIRKAAHDSLWDADSSRADSSRVPLSYREIPLDFLPVLDALATPRNSFLSSISKSGLAHSAMSQQKIRAHGAATGQMSQQQGTMTQQRSVTGIGNGKGKCEPEASAATFKTWGRRGGDSSVQQGVSDGDESCSDESAEDESAWDEDAERQSTIPTEQSSPMVSGVFWLVTLGNQSVQQAFACKADLVVKS